MAALVRSGVPTVVTGTSLIADSVAEATMVGYHELLLAGAAPAEALAAAVANARAGRGSPRRSVASARDCSAGAGRPTRFSPTRSARMLYVTTGDRAVTTPPIRSTTTPPARSTTSTTDGALTAAGLWAQARGQVDIGRPGTGLRLGTRALHQLRREHLPDAEASVLRARILVTMADAQVELGQIPEATESLDDALRSSPAALPVVQASRGVLLARTGKPEVALLQFDAAIAALSESGRPGSNLVRALLWRGLLHLGEARLDEAQADCEAAGRLGRDAGLDAAVVIATHTLGLVRWVSGDLPGALHAMSTADEVRPEVRSGIRALDRAKVLLAAGLLAEAREFTERAEQVFTAEHSKVDLADSLLVQAEIDLVARQSRTARSAARRAARSYAAAGHQRGLLAARVMEARAESIVRSSIRPLPRHRARDDAGRAGALVDELVDSGLYEDARAVKLLEAEALLEAGDIKGAELSARAAADLGAGNGPSNRARRVPLIATELQTRVVAARLDLASGRRSAGLAHVRRGLDELAVAIRPERVETPLPRSRSAGPAGHPEAQREAAHAGRRFAKIRCEAQIPMADRVALVHRCPRERGHRRAAAAWGEHARQRARRLGSCPAGQCSLPPTTASTGASCGARTGPPPAIRAIFSPPTPSCSSPPTTSKSVKSRGGSPPLRPPKGEDRRRSRSPRCPRNPASHPRRPVRGLRRRRS